MRVAVIGAAGRMGKILIEASVLAEDVVFSAAVVPSIVSTYANKSHQSTKNEFSNPALSSETTTKIQHNNNNRMGNKKHI